MLKIPRIRPTNSEGRPFSDSSDRRGTVRAGSRPTIRCEDDPSRCGCHPKHRATHDPFLHASRTAGGSRGQRRGRGALVGYSRPATCLQEDRRLRRTLLDDLLPSHRRPEGASAPARLVTLFAAIVGLIAAGTGIADGPDPQKLIDSAEDMVKGETARGTIEMTVTRPDFTRTMRMKSWWEGNEKALIVIEAPTSPWALSTPSGTASTSTGTIPRACTCGESTTSERGCLSRAVRRPAGRRNSGAVRMQPCRCKRDAPREAGASHSAECPTAHRPIRITAGPSYAALRSFLFPEQPPLRRHLDRPCEFQRSGMG
jgi:hypothetical protein